MKRRKSALSILDDNQKRFGPFGSKNKKLVDAFEQNITAKKAFIKQKLSPSSLPFPTLLHNEDFQLTLIEVGDH